MMRARTVVGLTVLAVLAVLAGLGDGKVPAGARTVVAATDWQRVAFLTFDTPVTGTIQDHNCDGTGFSDRLPGTGGSLSPCDPHLDLSANSGRLTVTSTHFDINNSGVNLGIAETLGVKLTGIGTADFDVSALFRDVQLSELSDQLMVYVATDAARVFRAGLHYQSSPEYRLIQSLNGSDFAAQVAGTFDVGDDIRVTVSRTAGSTYSVRYENLTNPANSASDAVTFHWLDSASDLYVGVLYANNAGKVPDKPKTSQIDEFTVDVGTGSVGGKVLLPPSALADASSGGSRGSGNTVATWAVFAGAIVGTLTLAGWCARSRRRTR